MKKALIIVAQKAFQPDEYLHTKEMLEKSGISVNTASSKIGEAVGYYDVKTNIDFAISSVSAENYDAFVLIGGAGARNFLKDKNLIRLIQTANRDRKIVAGICIAPIILAEAGVINGRKATVWNGDSEQEKFIVSKGAKYINQPVVVDSNIITADGPNSAYEFGKTIAKLLG